MNEFNWDQVIEFYQLNKEELFSEQTPLDIVKTIENEMILLFEEQTKKTIFTT